MEITGSITHQRVYQSSQGGVHKDDLLMNVAKSKSQTTAAAPKFIEQVDSSIMELRSQNLRKKLFLLETWIQKSFRTHDKTSNSQPNVKRR
jgi:hypothetical protein